MCQELDKPDKNLVAACGLFCPSCAIFIASNENDSDRLKRQASELNITVEEVRCKGCRSEKRNAYCNTCFMLKCTKKKNVDFCSECNEYPCVQIVEFQSKLPHRIELWKDLQRIKKVGYETFYVESLENYKCSSCATINSGWDLSCRKCGNSPSCKYVENNQAEIKKRL